MFPSTIIHILTFPLPPSSWVDAQKVYARSEFSVNSRNMGGKNQQNTLFPKVEGV